jgi:hypothetical protein
MQPQGYLPIYHNTNDQRIIKFLQRNWTTHELNTTSNDITGFTKEIYKPSAPIQIIGSVKPRTKKGRIRKALFVGASLVVALIYASAWGWL